MFERSAIEKIEIEALNEVKGLKLPELEKKMRTDSDIYINLLKEKNKLEKTFYDKSLDAKTRAEAGAVLVPLTFEFMKFEKKHTIQLQVLESRLIASMTDEQRQRFETSTKARFK